MAETALLQRRPFGVALGEVQRREAVLRGDPADMGMVDPPSSIDPCPAHNAVFAGKPYGLIARYDNSQPYTDVMGIALTYIWRGHQ